jgi:anti-sigma regulatory factor (Ser/Thr protein kinase)
MSGQASSADPIRQDDAELQRMEVFPRRVESVAGARTWLSMFLREQGVPPELCGDAVLVMSELVTNALRHGLGDIVARASFTGGVLHLSVTDSGRELPQLQAVDVGRVGGVGLHIVEKLSTLWGISAFPGGKTVWAMMPPAPTG